MEEGRDLAAATISALEEEGNAATTVVQQKFCCPSDIADRTKKDGDAGCRKPEQSSTCERGELLCSVELEPAGGVVRRLSCAPSLFLTGGGGRGDAAHE